MTTRTCTAMPWPRLAVLAATAAMVAVALHLVGARTGWPDGETVAAMEVFVRAQRVLWAARDARVDEATRTELAITDPLRTGLVGVEWSPLTTTPGSLAAKRTTAHPLWVALFRGWFSEQRAAGVDTVAIGASGSFPGIFIAARIAAESLQLRTVVVGSLTSSNYGANLPEMDLAEMDHVVRAAGLLAEAPAGFSPGGDDDAARDLDDADRRALYERLAELGPLGHDPGDLATSLAWRDEVLLGRHEARRGTGASRVFVNIGGHAANYGVGVAPLALPAGVIPAGGERHAAGLRSGPGDSIALRAIRRGYAVINVLNIRGLAAAHGIPFDPARIPPPSTVRLPERLSPTIRVAAGSAALGLLILLVVWRVAKPGPREWFELGRGDCRRPDSSREEGS
jgi:poly-gamma-glutamate system protein